MKLYRLLLAILFIAAMMACSDQDAGPGDLVATDDGVVLTPRDEQAARVRVRVVAPGIFRVTASADDNFERAASLMRAGTLAAPAFEVDAGKEVIEVRTAHGSAQLSRNTGAVTFLDASGNELLAERAERGFEPYELAGATRYAIRQRFDPGPGDAFYGLGQHQNGQFNYRGENVELAQHNISIAVPFLASTGGYGILWDNNSITRFGDPRPFAPLEDSFFVRGPDGSEGGFEGRYFDGEDVAVTLREADPDYEFLEPDQYLAGAGTRDVWPEPFVDQSPDRIVWTGSIEAREAGLHKFRVYASHFIKVRIDGELVVDRWRQNWNPYYFLFEREMAPGERHEVEIEWLPNDGYFRIAALSPQPADEADDLSLWSEVADVIDYYFVAGETLDEVVSGYRSLTGKAVLLPNWTYGFWQSRQRYTTQQELLDVLGEYRKRGIPIDNIVQDWFYWREDDWGSHEFDPERFPDPQGMVDAVHDMNAQVMISVWPKFYPTTDNFRELDEIGAIYQRSLEKKTRDWVGPGYANTFYDPYSEAARHIYWRQMQETLDVLGFDAWWMDATEPDLHSNLSHEERKLRMGPTALGPGAEYFNSYALMNAMAVYEGERNGSDPDERVFILTRSGFPGLQRYASAAWSGDVVARWDDLREQIPAGLNMTLAGIPNWTFDIGGFAVESRYSEEDPAHLDEWRELNLRWFQFGAFAPLFRSHGEYPFREIFNLADEGSEVYDSLVFYDKVRYRLLPYIYSVAAETWHGDGSIMRAMVMDFADDETTHDIGDQYLFGPSLLVAPVYEYGARSRRVYLPRGATWIDVNSEESYDGGQWIDAPAPLARIPVFAKAGAIIPTTTGAQYAAEALNGDLVLLVYPGADGRFALVEDDGTTYAYERGAFSRIELGYDDAGSTLTIGERKGEFEGMAKERSITVFWMGADAVDVTVQYSGDELRVARP
jgi:alpha-D-xyloside xylohydrolase